MRAKRPIHFEYLWNGYVHLDDGSEWWLADPSQRREVTWWSTGEAVEIQRHRYGIVLRNLLRNETITLTPSVAELEMAA